MKFPIGNHGQADGLFAVPFSMPWPLESLLTDATAMRIRSGALTLVIALGSLLIR